MRERSLGAPEAAHDLEPFLEDLLIVFEIDPERRVLAPVVTPAGRKIDAPVAEEIERRPLFGDPDRVMQREDRDGGGEPDSRGASGEVGQHEVGTREHAERAEVMLPDPGRVQADLFGIQRLVEDVCDERIRIAGVVQVMVVAQREITELHL